MILDNVGGLWYWVVLKVCDTGECWRDVVLCSVGGMWYWVVLEVCGTG